MSKYPRTLHLPTSPGATRDDRRHETVDSFAGKTIIFTEKLDGSNVCMQPDGCFARSHNQAPHHPSFDAFKALYAGVRHLLPEGYQFFGEWLYAKHSIHYTQLTSYFHLIGVRDPQGTWLSWDEVQIWSQALWVPTVPLLAIVKFSQPQSVEKYIEMLAKEATSHVGGEREGFVGRWADAFHDSEFEQAVGKWVRAGHVTSDDHWSHQAIVRNLLQG